MISKLKGLILLIILLSAILTSCVKEADNFPLKVDDGGTEKSTYTLNQPSTEFSISILFVRNVSDEPITIDSVSLINPKSMTLLETSLMAIGEERMLLGFTTWPPESAVFCPGFADRISADNASIEPDQGFNLIVVVRNEETVSSADGIQIQYHDSAGNKYVEKSNYSYWFNDDGIEADD